MTKADIIDAVCKKNGFSKRKSAKTVEDILDIIKETLENGENVKLSGFGSFNIQYKRSRRGRNPQTCEKMTISARRILSFKSSNVLREKLLEKF